MSASPGLYKLGYSVYASDSSYTQGQLLDYKSLGFVYPYQFQLPNAGYYLLKVGLQVTPPGAPRPDIKMLTFKIHADGSFKHENSGNMNCTNGVCEDIANDCTYYQDVFQRMNCAMQKQLSIGVINPSITAFKGLLTSVVVPENPTCNIPLTDITIISGNVFPLSGFSSKACTSSTELRTAFPVIPVVINFLFGFALFAMIVRLINRALKKEHNDLIEGV